MRQVSKANDHGLSFSAHRSWKDRFALPLLFLLFGLLAFANAHAIQITPFGPTHYTRQSGAPVEETASFTVDNLNGSFTLTVHNGGLEDDATLGKYVSSSTITINGVVVLGPQNFNQNVTVLNVPVSLLSSNQLVVKLNGKPGGVITVEINGEVNSAPVADAGINQTLIAGNTVTLDGSASSDLDGDALSYQWSLIGKPAASQAVLSNATASSASYNADIEGDYVAQLIVNDGTVDSAPSQVLITALPQSQPPVLSLIGHRNIEPGSTLALTLTATDPNGDAIIFSAQSLPLPDGATLDGETGAFVFKPTADQAGSTIDITFIASDGDLIDTETVSFTIAQIDAAATTRFSGRLLDANAYQHGTVVPIIGATISFLQTGQSAISDSQGYFSLDNLSDGRQVLDIDPTNAQPGPNGVIYAGFREHFNLIGNVLNDEQRPFYLPQLDQSSLTVVDPTTTTVISNTALGATLTIPANTAKNEDGSNFTGSMSISLVPRNLAPAAMPDNLDPGVLLTIQPVGVTFATPVPLSLPNTDNLSPGSEVDIWSLDPEMGTFSIVGVGQVSADALRIDTISGGIRAADWHMFLPPKAAAADQSAKSTQITCQQDATQSTSTIRTSSGCLDTGFNLPGYFSQGQSRSLAFNYRTDRANTHPVIPFDITIPVRSTIPDKISYEIYVGGVKQGNEIYISTTGLSESVDETMRAAATYDASLFDTGIYPYRIRITNHFEQSSVSADINGQVNIVNDVAASNPLGVGWGIPGISRLNFQGSGSILWVDGSGSTVKYLQEGSNNPSLYFDGNDFILRRSIPSLNAHTIEFWIKLDETQQHNVGIGGIGPAGGGCGYGSVIRVLRDRRVYQHIDPAGCGGHGSSFIVTPALATVWKHFAGTYDGSIHKVYIDGEFIKEDTALYTQSTNFALGTDAFAFRQGYMKGHLDEVRVWDHARSQTDIQNHMQSSLNGAENGLILYWPMDEGQGTLIQDASGSGLTGDFTTYGTGSPSWKPSGAPMNCTDNNCRYVSGDGDFSTLTTSGNNFILTLVNGNEIHFDAQGLQTHTIDRNGNATQYAYDAQQRLISITDPVGKVTTLSYTGAFLDTVTDPAGRISVFEYDQDGNLIKITFPDTSFKLFGYDSHHLMTTETDQRGNTAIREYDILGRIFRAVRRDGSIHLATHAQTSGLVTPGSGLGTIDNPVPFVRPTAAASTFTDGENHTKISTTDRLGRLTSRTDANNLTTRIDRDDNGNAIKITRPDDSIINQVFDEYGNLLSQTEVYNNASIEYSYDPVYHLLSSVIDALDETTTYHRDSQGNITSIVNALGHTTTLVNNSAGLVTKITTPNGLVTDYTYNTAGLPETITETPPANGGVSRTTQIAYNNVGLASQIITAPDGLTINLDYDPQGRLRTVTDLLNQTVNYRYDAAGNRTGSDIKETDGSLTTTLAQSFDALDRLKSVTQPHISGQDSVQQFLYDDADNPSDSTDPKGNVSTQLYDPGNRLVEHIDALLGSTIFDYNKNGQVTQTIAPNGAVTDHLYDPLGRVTSETSADRGTVTYSYDLNDNPASMTDARGVTITYLYDELNRLTDIQYPDASENITLSYDQCALGLGRLCSVTDASGSASFAYDAYGNTLQITEIRDNISYSQHYQYDAGDRLVNMTLPTGLQLSYGRDSLKRIQSISTDINSASQSIVSNMTYNAADQLLQRHYGNGLIETRSYDLQSRLLQQTLNSIDQTGLSYDANSNVLTRNTSTDTHSYDYDVLDRLTQEINNSIHTDYDYDANDNRTLETQNAQSIVYDYTLDSNLLDTITTGSISQTLSYDAAGNITQDTQGRQYHYNNAGRLKEILDNGGQILATYRYDANGLRTHKTTATQTTLYHYNLAGQLSSETLSDGTAVRDYIWQGSNPVAQIDYQNGTQTLTYLHTDQLNTPRLATSSNQGVAWRWEGDAFGKAQPQSFGATINLRFPGQYHDLESGLYYNHHRYYQPQTGRYITSDPIGLAGGLNTYGYVSGNPLSYTDSSGLLIDALADIGFIAYDLYRLAADNVFGSCNNLGENLSALGADVGGLFIPGATGLGLGVRAAKSVANPVPGTLARVVPGNVNPTTLGRTADVFVTDAKALQGLNAKQIADKLTIPQSSSGFKVIEFPTPSSGIASPVFRNNPGFVGGGRTAGGAPEFVIPNGPVPAGATTRIVQ